MSDEAVKEQPVGPGPLVVDTLIGACEKMKEWAENQFSDTDYDLDGCMAEVHAEFSNALYDARKYFREPAPLKRESVEEQPKGESDCPACGGLGCLTSSEAACCGNVHNNGECRSHCCIEQQCQIQCPYCGGSGKIQSPLHDTGIGKDDVERVAIAICPWANDKKSISAPENIWRWLANSTRNAYREQAKAALAAMPRPATGPTEAMCNEACGFILGLDLNIRNFADMEKHLDRGGYSCIPYIREMAAHGQGSYITKWDVAACIWQLMARTQPINLPPAPEGE